MGAPNLDTMCTSSTQWTALGCTTSTVNISWTNAVALTRHLTRHQTLESHTVISLARPTIQCTAWQTCPIRMASDLCTSATQVHLTSHNLVRDCHENELHSSLSYSTCACFVLMLLICWTSAGALQAATPGLKVDSLCCTLKSRLSKTAKNIWHRVHQAFQSCLSR